MTKNCQHSSTQSSINEMFFWNLHLQSRIIEYSASSGYNLSAFILPLINGCTFFKKIEIKKTIQ